MHVTLGGRSNGEKTYFESLLYTKSFFPGVHRFVRVAAVWGRGGYLVISRNGDDGYARVAREKLLTKLKPARVTGSARLGGGWRVHNVHRQRGEVVGEG